MKFYIVSVIYLFENESQINMVKKIKELSQLDDLMKKSILSEEALDLQKTAVSSRNNLIFSVIALTSDEAEALVKQKMKAQYENAQIINIKAFDYSSQAIVYAGIAQSTESPE